MWKIPPLGSREPALTRGAPTDEIYQYADQFLRQLAETGTVLEAMKGIPIGRSRWNWLRHQDVAFGQAWQMALEQATDKLENAARNRAIEGIEKGVWHQGEKVGSERVYSDGLLQFLLKGNRDKYRDRIDHAHQHQHVALIIQTTREEEGGAVIEAEPEPSVFELLS